ncbi:hypothetical protein LCGC14_2837820, partial [marine sediment metagenome]
WDLPFRGARNLIRRIPKTPVQAATSYARGAYMESRAYLRQLLGKDISTVSKAEVVESFELAIKQYSDMPFETGNRAVQVGNYLTQYDFLDETFIRKLYKDAGVATDVTPQLVHDFNMKFDLFFKKSYTAKEVASELLIHAGVEPTEKVLKRMITTLERERTKIVDGATDLLRGESARDVLDSVYRNIEDMQLRKFSSPIYQYAIKSGRATSYMTRAVDKFVRNNLVSWLDRHVTAPMANQYLLFTNYGPFNALESTMRSFLGAGELFYPRASSPVDEVVRMGEGLSNFPYEFIRAQQGLGRLEIAVTNPKTGETIVFKGGKIPGITRDLPKGLRIKIGQKEYPIRSMQGWNDMFGDIGTNQRAWYYLTKNKQVLWEVAPDEMASLAKVFDDNQPLLDGVA